MQFEKLGAFYLGREYELDGRKILDDLVLYDAKDLTTHAVCVGMTGSGKTGLCLSIIEEAAIDGIPAIAIDPKGDLGNLLLSFPDLDAASFRPWIDEAEAARNGEEPDRYAATIAARWRKGLAQWGQDGSRIERMHAAADFAIYTPGSLGGAPLRVMKSFDAPQGAAASDAEAMRDRVDSNVSGLLGLVGVDADPVRSREHVLLSRIFEDAWSGGRNLDLAAVIRAVQSPPFERLGVLDLESFFPAKERFELAMRLNNVLAAPGFAAWMAGEPLDVRRLLWTEQGKPRISILSIAHLSEEERMFFVTLLLGEIVSWMRSQPGTSSLRALLYMDEVFGFLPPSANPPSKRPLLTLLKQARAYGLGVVLATQNPVDLDYKALSNSGTWFLGRLQTERDKARVLEGLEGAAAGGRFDRSRMEQVLAGLDSRIFVMHNVHEDEPVVFHTRWALSYLRGPLTLPQIRELSGGAAKTEAPRATPGKTTAPRKAVAKAPATTDRPVLPPGVRELFFAGEAAAGAPVYRPALVGTASLHFVDRRRKVDEWRSTTLVAPLAKGARPDKMWGAASEIDGGLTRVDSEPNAAFGFADLPPIAARADSYKRWPKTLADHLYKSKSVGLFRQTELKCTSSVGESEADFRIRLAQLAREKRDREVARLEKRYTPKLARLQKKILRTQEKLQREQSQYGTQKLQTAISVGATVLGALFGRKAASVGTVGRATTAVRGASRAARERGDVARAGALLEENQRDLAEMEQEFQSELDAVRATIDPMNFELEEISIRPRKSDTMVEQVALLWIPDASGGSASFDALLRFALA